MRKNTQNESLEIIGFIIHKIIDPISLQGLPLEVSVLQVFYVYVQQCPGSQLGECWGPLLMMVKDGTIGLSSPAQLVLLATLNEFVQRAAAPQEKKDMKELQVSYTL